MLGPKDVLSQTELAKLEGLPGNTCYSVVQDSTGYIWISTNNGIARFNGEEIIVFNKEEIPNSWSGSDYIRYMTLTNDNNLLLVTASDIKLFNVTTKQTTIIDSGKTRYAVQDSSGVFWWTMNGVLKRCQIKHDSTFNFNTYDKTPKLSYYLYPDLHNDAILAFSENKDSIYSLNIKNNTVVSKATNFKKSSVPPAWVQYINLITSDKQILSYNFETKSLDTFLDISNNPEVTASMTDHIMRSQKNSYFILNTVGELIECSKDSIHRIWSFKEEMSKNRVKRVSSFLIDKSKTIWLATTNGMYHTSFQQDFTFHPIPLINQSSRSITPIGDSIVYIGTYRGIFSHNIINKQTIKLEPNIKNIYEIYKTGPNNLIVGKDNGELLKLSDVGFDIIDSTFRLTTSIIKISHDSIILGGDKLHLFNNGVLTRLFPDILNQIRIEHIAFFDRHIYIQSSKGIYEVSRDLKSIRPFLDSEGLKYGHYNYLTEWNRDSFLCASKSFGLLLVNAKGQVLHSWDTSKGLSTNNVSGVIIINDKFWTPTSAGLNVIDHRSGNTQIYTEENGLLSNDLNKNSFLFIKEDSLLLIGSTKGVISCNPYLSRCSDESHQVIIQNKKVFSRNGIVIEQEECVLGVNDRFVEINYFTPNYNHPKSIEYSYMIEGIDNDFQSLGSSNRLQLAGLPYGNHTISIRSRPIGKFWGNKSTRIPIRVKKPFYLTLPFLICVGICIFTLIGLYYRRKIQRWKHREKEQLNQSRKIQHTFEKEKRKISSYLHDNLGQQLTILKLKNNDQNLNTEISSMINKLRNVSRSVYPQGIDQVGLSNTVNALCTHLTTQTAIIISSDLEDFNSTYNKEETLILYRFIQEALNNVIKHSGAKSAIVRYLSNSHCIEILDNGKGLDFQNIQFGEGIVGLQAKAELLKAQIKFENTFPGFRIELRLPNEQTKKS